MEIRNIDDFLREFKQIGRKMEECGDDHKGPEEIIGPSSGKYSPSVTVKCGYCSLIYEKDSD